jgi:hypothetical protein
MAMKFSKSQVVIAILVVVIYSLMILIVEIARSALIYLFMGTILFLYWLKKDKPVRWYVVGTITIGCLLLISSVYLAHRQARVDMEKSMQIISEGGYVEELEIPYPEPIPNIFEYTIFFNLPFYTYWLLKSKLSKLQKTEITFGILFTMVAVITLTLTIKTWYALSDGLNNLLITQETVLMTMIISILLILGMLIELIFLFFSVKYLFTILKNIKK